MHSEREVEVPEKDLEDIPEATISITAISMHIARDAMSTEEDVRSIEELASSSPHNPQGATPTTSMSSSSQNPKGVTPTTSMSSSSQNPKGVTPTTSMSSSSQNPKGATPTTSASSSSQTPMKGITAASHSRSNVSLDGSKHSTFLFEA